MVTHTDECALTHKRGKPKTNNLFENGSCTNTRMVASAGPNARSGQINHAYQSSSPRNKPHSYNSHPPIYRQTDREKAPTIFSARDAPQESLGFSPFELVFGHSVHGPLSMLKENWLQDFLLLEMNIFQFQLEFSSVDLTEAFTETIDPVKCFPCRKKESNNPASRPKTQLSFEVNSVPKPQIACCRLTVSKSNKKHL